MMKYQFEARAIVKFHMNFMISSWGFNDGEGICQRRESLCFVHQPWKTWESKHISCKVHSLIYSIIICACKAHILPPGQVMWQSTGCGGMMWMVKASNNWGECAAFAMKSTNGKTLQSSWTRMIHSRPHLLYFLCTGQQGMLKNPCTSPKE